MQRRRDERRPGAVQPLDQTVPMATPPQELGPLFRRLFAGRRFVVVSNREPYEHKWSHEGVGEMDVARPAGGLTSALDPLLQALGGMWVAWGSGDADAAAVNAVNRVRVPPEDPSYTLRRVWLTHHDIHRYYLGFANQFLWPLCHLRPDLTRVRSPLLGALPPRQPPLCRRRAGRGARPAGRRVDPGLPPGPLRAGHPRPPPGPDARAILAHPLSPVRDLSPGAPGVVPAAGDAGQRPDGLSPPHARRQLPPLRAAAGGGGGGLGAAHGHAGRPHLPRGRVPHLHRRGPVP